jgi:hypothetical protein
MRTPGEIIGKLRVLRPSKWPGRWVTRCRCGRQRTFREETLQTIVACGRCDKPLLNKKHPDAGYRRFKAALGNLHDKEFHLTPGDYNRLTLGRICTYCADPHPDYVTKKVRHSPWTRTNCIPCCRTCFDWKGLHHSHTQFIARIRAMAGKIGRTRVRLPDGDLRTGGSIKR